MVDFYTTKDITSSDILLCKNYMGMLLLDISNVQSPIVYSVVDVLKKDIEIKENEVVIQNKNNYWDFYKQIETVLNFEYEHKDAKYIPSKKSISELIEDNEISLMKIKNDNVEITSAQRGTLIHFILQNINLTKVSTVGEIEVQLENMIAKGMRQIYCLHSPFFFYHGHWFHS